MIRIICHGCQHRFQRTAAQVLSEGRCPRCASTDIDADDGWDEKDASRRTAQSEANWVQDREVSGFWSANYGGITLEVQTGYDEPYEYLVDPGGDPGQIISGTSKTLEDAKANAEAVARNEFMASRRQAKAVCPDCNEEKDRPRFRIGRGFCHNAFHSAKPSAAQQKAAGASTSYYGDHWRLVYGDYEPLLWEVYADMDGDQPPIASGTGGNLQAGILGLQEALISAGFDDVVDLDSASSISRFSRFSRPRTAAVDPPNIAIAREVVRTRTFDRANGLDTFSASAIVQVYDALSESNKARFGAMSLAQMSDAAFRLLNKASTLQQPTDIGEPKKTMCPNCGTAQFNPVAGLCAQCGYTEDDFTKNEREARRIAAVEWKRTFAPYGENMGLWVQEAVINGRRMEKAEQYAMQYGQRTAAGPNGFWCPECGKYQSVRTSAEANAAREHMRGHKAGKVAGAAPSENIYSVLVGDEVGTYIVHYKDGHSDQNVLWEEMSEEAQSVWRNQHTSSAIEEVNAPFGPSNNVVSLAETARCSSCMAEFRYEASKPNASVPECPRCGSRATSPAGATGTGAKEASIVRDILASNPGMEHHMATAIAKETLRRFPKVAGSR